MNQMVKLFGRDKSVISRHLSNVFKINELDKSSVVAKFATTASDGKTYQVAYYNLDAIISVGHRVNSIEGARFSGARSKKNLLIYSEPDNFFYGLKNNTSSPLMVSYCFYSV